MKGCRILEPWIAWDRKLFIWIHQQSGEGLDYILAWPTFFGSTVTVLLLAFAMIRIWDPARWKPKFAVFSVGILGLKILEYLLKVLFSRPRPFENFSDWINGPAEIAPVLFQLPSSYSFPSGHAATAFAAAALLNGLYAGRLRFLYFLAFWVALSRVYIGVHYPADVLAGALLGIAWGTLASAAAKSRLKIEV